MENMNELMNEFKKCLNKGNIQKTYRYIFELFSDIGKELKKCKDKVITVNSTYHGYLDMTYIPVVTETLKENGLKIAIVFNYDHFQFEIWLSSINRNRRKEFLEIINNKKFKKFKTVENNRNEDAIIEYCIEDIKDFNNKEKIISMISKEILKFICDIETFLKDNAI